MAETTLKDRLLRRIRAEGPITFAEFMEAALYDPEEGFYAGLPVGPDEHFVTSPHVSSAFGDLLARQLAESWELLDKPEPFRVVEVGAGDGTLARRVVQAARAVAPFGEALEYETVERSAPARRALAEAGFPVHETLADAGSAHCVLANEVLDNLPFHRLRRSAGRVVEVVVGEERGRLVEEEADPTPAALEALRGPLDEDEERPVSLAALAFLGEVAKSLERGYAFLFDYGFAPGERPSAVHAYHRHRVSPDVLADPGRRDVTAAVDLGAVAAEAERLGITVWGPVRQREALLALGIRLWIRGARARQEEAEARGDWREANRVYGERSRASILIDEDKLGSLRVLVLGTQELPAPAAVLGDRRSGC